MGRPAYRGWPECPLLVPALAEAQGHPLFHFLQRGIATNGPSHLSIHGDYQGLLQYAPKLVNLLLNPAASIGDRAGVHAASVLRVGLRIGRCQPRDGARVASGVGTGVGART